MSVHLTCLYTEHVCTPNMSVHLTCLYTEHVCTPNMSVHLTCLYTKHVCTWFVLQLLSYASATQRPDVGLYFILFSSEEAAHYLEMYKAFEHKPPDALKEKLDSDLSSRVVLPWRLSLSCSVNFTLKPYQCRLLNACQV